MNKRKATNSASGRHRSRKPNQTGQKDKNTPRAPNIKSIHDCRALSALIVYEVYVNHQSLNSLLPLTSHQIEEKDKALRQELVFGTCRWFFWLKTLYIPFLSKPIHRNDFLVESLICVGIYQILFTRIPVHASLNETVEAAEKLGLNRFKGLINAILRQVSRLDINIQDPDTYKEAAIKSHPQWIQDKLRHNMPENWASILKENNEHPPMSLRLNAQFYAHDTSGKNIQEIYLEKLANKNMDAKDSKVSPYGIILNSACPVQSLPDFIEGGVSIQDEAAQLSSHLMDLKPKLRVLDACAAPGGKTCAMLEKEPSLSLIALDSDSARADKIQENLARLKLNAEIKIAQAQLLETWWDGEAFDRILLDAPCSATGVIRRHPDIKLLRQEGDIKQLAELQLQLITTLWQTLKPGGRLLYATCSIFSQENSRIVERFLKQTEDAELLPIKSTWGQDTGFGTQLLPEKGGHDGFFYARIQKLTNE